ncbi:MAG: cytochrome P450 [Gemmatimonadaceae bacterium]|nr:cytochrome P450 [Gemmatimonadaceae bacterium]
MPAAMTANAPGPRSRFPGEMILRMTRERLALLRQMAATHGDVSQMRLGKQLVVLLTHPDDIRDVLVTHQKLFRKGQALERAKVLIGDGLLTAEGEAHLRQRRLVQPAFPTGRASARTPMR